MLHKEKSMSCIYQKIVKKLAPGEGGIDDDVYLKKLLGLDCKPSIEVCGKKFITYIELNNNPY